MLHSPPSYHIEVVKPARLFTSCSDVQSRQASGCCMSHSAARKRHLSFFGNHTHINPLVSLAALSAVQKLILTGTFHVSVWYPLYLFSSCQVWAQVWLLWLLAWIAYERSDPVIWYQQLLNPTSCGKGKQTRSYYVDWSEVIIFFIPFPETFAQWICGLCCFSSPSWGCSPYMKPWRI